MDLAIKKALAGLGTMLVHDGMVFKLFYVLIFLFCYVIVNHMHSED